MSDKKTKVENCNLCAMCNLDCPIYSVILKESAAPRFKAFLAKKKDFKDIFYLCTRCGSCVNNCPANIDIECLKIRKEIVNKGHETKQNKIMKDNIMLHGNPFGKVKKNMVVEHYYT